MMYSVVVILDWHRPDVVETLSGLSEILKVHNKQHEFILVANDVGSKYLDRLSFDRLGDVNVKLVNFTRTVATGMCLSGALPHCEGEVVMTCAPYMQLTGEAIASMLEAFEQGADMVIPHRLGRVDPGINQAQSRFFNRVVQRTTATEFKDLSCPYRVMRKEILNDFHLYGDLYRYLPIIAQRCGYRVVEIPCTHRAEEVKKGVYPVRAYVGRLIDFLTFHFDLYSSRKPLRYFGKRALYFLTPGAVLTLILLAGAALNLFQVGNSPWLILALVLLLLGSMIWSVGLLGEVIAFAHGRHRKEYQIEVITD